MQTSYPIRAVAKITGLSLDTLRAWERRYSAVVPERSDRGRQYGTAHIERLLLLNQLVKKGHAIGGIAVLADDDLKKLLVPPLGRASPEPEPAIDILGPLLAAIESFDSSRAGDELSRLAAVLSPRDLVYRVVVPLMHEVGARWHDGQLAIAQEHLVSQLLRNLLGSMVQLFRSSNPTMKMVLATPAGESHEFGILASAMLEPICLRAKLAERRSAFPQTWFSSGSRYSTRPRPRSYGRLPPRYLNPVSCGSVVRASPNSICPNSEGRPSY
jgi:MerR family transcriptional regulator, light-induced transcriptional regulator